MTFWENERLTQMNQFVMSAFTKLTHIPNGLARGYQQKPSGKKLLVGTKKLKQRQFSHGVINRQIPTRQIY